MLMKKYTNRKLIRKMINVVHNCYIVFQRWRQ